MKTTPTRYPQCSSHCKQGRRQCAAPDACLLAEDDPDNLRPARGLVAAIVITAALAALVILLTGYGGGL